MDMLYMAPHTDEFYKNPLDKEIQQRIYEINSYLKKEALIDSGINLEISIRFMEKYSSIKKLLRYNKESGKLEEILSGFYVRAFLRDCKDGRDIVIPKFIDDITIMFGIGQNISSIILGDYVQSIQGNILCEKIEISKANPYIYCENGRIEAYKEREVYEKIGMTREEVIKSNKRYF